jgi:hypothetical protein
MLATTVLMATFVLRVWGIDTNFWLLRDQIRDWEAVQGPLSSLPLVGPATHVGGYTIGPAFYWILWLIRVLVGPWFDNLPHAGGIGQAALQSGVDVLLLVAVWRRMQSPWIATAVVTLVATSGFDLSYAGITWNPIVGSTLAKCAVALVLLDWYRGSALQVATTTTVAWAAVHAYTGAIYVTAGVLGAIVLDPIVRKAGRDVRRHIQIVAAVILVLQIPDAWFQIATAFRWPAMGAVTGSLAQVVTGHAAPEVAKSLHGLVAAFTFIQIAPWTLPLPGVALLASAVVVSVRYRRDNALLLVTVVPLGLAIAGYALFLDTLDNYYYLSLMPSAVLMVVLAVTAWPARGVSRAAAMALCIGALALVPSRVRFGRGLNPMPEYGVLVQASRTIANRGVAMRAIRTDFPLPPTGDPEFVYRMLGGRLDRTSRWVATIDRRGAVTYRDVGGA